MRRYRWNWKNWCLSWNWFLNEVRMLLWCTLSPGGWEGENQKTKKKKTWKLWTKIVCTGSMISTQTIAVWVVFPLFSSSWRTKKNVAREKLLRKEFSEKFCCWARWRLSLDVYIKHEIFRSFTRSCKVSINLRIPLAASLTTRQVFLATLFFSPPLVYLRPQKPSLPHSGMGWMSLKLTRKLDSTLNYRAKLLLLLLGRFFFGAGGKTVWKSLHSHRRLLSLIGLLGDAPSRAMSRALSLTLVPTTAYNVARSFPFFSKLYLRWAQELFRCALTLESLSWFGRKCWLAYTESEQRTKLKYPHWKNIIKYEFVSYLIHSTLSSPLNFPQFFLSSFFLHFTTFMLIDLQTVLLLHFLSNRKCCLQKGKFITFKCVICDLYAKASKQLFNIHRTTATLSRWKFVSAPVALPMNARQEYFKTCFAFYY